MAISETEIQAVRIELSSDHKDSPVVPNRVDMMSTVAGDAPCRLLQV